MKTKQGLNRLLAICALLHVAMLGYATIAYPGLVEFKQPNGNIVKVTMRGSETLKWAETEDGYTLMYDSIGNLVYAELDAMGDLVPSNVIATDVDFRPAEVEMRLMATPKRLAYSQRQMAMAEQVQQARSRQMAQLASSGTPAVGTRKMLLILVDFPDYPFQKTREDFELLMNQLNYTDDGRYGSVRDFYRENSFGQLDLIHDVVGVYRLQYERAYYGGNTEYSRDNDPRQMALEAVTMAAADVNFADYDNDGDGTVDGVHIIYAGPGEEAGGGGDCIWAHSWTVSATVDGVRTYRYSCSPEIRGSGGSKMTHIGVICHEIGHVLGAMDFYDTNYGTGGQYPGTGQWDLMASGNWNGDGACPAHFNPYSKIYDYGWAAPADGNQAATFTLGAKSKEGFVRIDTQTDGEFFLLEYRAKSGFDLCAPYHGLMVYRASDGMSRMSANTLNAYHKQQFYPLVANAPNEIPTSVVSTYGSVNTSSAPFPGTLGIDELTDFTTPSMKSWVGVNTEFPITSIKENVSGESVTFDIAGGIEGGAYSFKVTDSDTLSITFGWKTPASETVVLAFSKEPTFGVPENRAYTVGETITGGGEVIYVGKELTFKHSGLEQQEEYYYKLFTLRADGTYTAGRQLKAETAVGVIRKFPYEEDFSSMLLPSTWRQELIIGEEPWMVEELDSMDNFGNYIGLGDWKLMYLNSIAPRRRARVIMPVIDFTDATCAALSFDYRNFLQIFEVEYRTSPTDEWHLLKSSEFVSNTNHTQNKYLRGEQHVDIKLPNLSSNYEIAFIVDHTFLGDNASSVNRVTIDNIKIQTDFSAIVATQAPQFISSTMAKVETIALDGTEKITAKGVQWSTDKTSWTTVKAGEDGVSVLTSLPIGTTIYYRGYATIASGETLYGDVLSFTTLSFSTGSGTEEDPFLIGSTADWTTLRTYVDAGNDCAGLTFALTNSFTLTNNAKSSGTFNGTLDGKGNSITLQTGNFNALFETLGDKGIVKNLTVKAESISTFDLNNALVCIYNYGTIVKTNVYVGQVILDTDCIFYIGGVACYNDGYIIDCHSEMYVSNMMLWCGGLCVDNRGGLIIGCSFTGELSCNNNGRVGGIVGNNGTSSRDGKELAGMVVDCINYGDINYYADVASAWGYHGGIVGRNYGRIFRCVNKGNLVSFPKISKKAAGITAGDQGEVTDCYNLGQISVCATTLLKPIEDLGVAGIVGDMRLGSISNCFSLTNVYAEDSNIEEVNEILGCNESADVHNCYFAGFGTDDLAERRALEDFATQEMVDLLNENGQNDVWVLGEKHPVLKWEGTGINMAIDYITDMRDTQITIPWIVSGENATSCGVEWREKGSFAWNRIEGMSNVINNTIIDGLTPKTSYEVRLYATTASGETMYSSIERTATVFASTGMSDDPHLITSYADMLAFNDMIACGEVFAGEIVRLTCDLDLRGEEGTLWAPMISRYDTDEGFNGEFDGAGHVISHMYIDTRSGFAGFFGRANGYIHDLSIVDSEVMCHAVSRANGYGGTGGIVGYGSVSSAYPYLVERCGFEGTVTGGHSIGGIVGEGGRNAVNDCYAKGTMTFSRPITGGFTHVDGRDLLASVGGVIGEGSASNSYFVGKVLLPESSGRVITFGIGWGPIAGLYYLDTSDAPNVNCYYNATSNKDFYTCADDISMTATEMTSDAFLNSLTADVWARADHLNEGYPVFASRAASRVSTIDAGHTANGDVEISAIYMAGADKEYHTHGFQWYSKMGDAMNIIETVIEGADDTYVLTIPNHQVSDEGVNYRAFAAQEGDSIFGEWKSFIPTFRSPQLLISDITVVDRNTATLEYVITAGTKEVVYTFEYAGVYEPDSVVSLPVDEALTKFSVANIKKMQEYKGVLVAATDAGIRVESEPFAWSQRTATAHALTYMIGDSVATVHYYEPGDVIDAVVVKDVFGMEFSGWEGLPATMPDNDLTVMGEYVVQYIAFADASVERICLSNWDTNSDGKLSMVEAAVVTDLGTVFKNNTQIKSFNELQYFTGLTKIASFTFQNCLSLETVRFPNTIVTIESYVFYDCSNLESLIIPASVTSFGYNRGSYNSCTKLAEIVVEEGNQVYDSRDNCNAVIQNNTLVLGCVNTVIPNTVREIGTYAFENCYGLLKIEIPESVTKINNTAFLSCTRLAEIAVEEGNQVYDSRDNCNAVIQKSNNTLVLGCMNTVIPNTVKEIGDYAFYNCYGLLKIEIPESVTKINGNAFSGCVEATEVNLPNSLEYIGSSAFSGCEKLRSLYIPTNVNTITNSSFRGCNSLQSIVVAEDNVTYDSRDNCNAIIETATNRLVFGSKNTIVPSSVAIIGNSAFWGCVNLTAINLPNSVTAIEDNALLNCTGLTSIKMPSFIVSIGRYAFQSCTELTSIELPATITSIGERAFIGCKGLTHIKVHWETPLAVTNDKYLFANVDISSVTLFVPEGTKALYEAAEVWKGFGTIEEFTSESDYTLGDPNNDGYIDVADLAAQVQFILGTAGSNLLLAAADMDASGVVEVNDYVALVNVILKQSNVYTRSAVGTGELDQLLQLAPVVVNEDGQGELWITLTAEQRQMSGFQLDLTLPVGVTIADEGITIGSRKHNAWCEPMGVNGYRIVCASLSNAAFASDTVMCVKLQAAGMKQGSYELTATGIVLSDTEAKRYESQAIRERVEVDGQDDGLQLSVNGDVLTLAARGDQQVLIALPNGMLVDSFELVDGAAATRVLPRGVYIVNGKKVVL